MPSLFVIDASILDKSNDLADRKLIQTVSRRWWIGLSAIVVGAGILRFTGFTFGLPYFENFDEPAFFYEAAFQRGLISNWLHPNPSQGLILFYKWLQIGAETMTGQSALLHAPDVIAVLRFISVWVSLLTLLFVGLCGRELAGNGAGWLAAGLWATIPLVVLHSANAIAEPWMMFLAAISLYTTAVAMKRGQQRYALIGVWAGLAAFAFKYSMFPFAGIGLAASLWGLWRQQGDVIQHRYWLRTISWQVVSIVAFLVLLTLFGGLVQDVSNPSREVAQFIKSPFIRLTDPQVIAQVVSSGFGQIGLTLLLFVGLIGAAFIVIERTSNQPLHKNSLVAIWIGFGLLGVFSMLLVPLYLMTDLTLLRYLFSADLIFSVLATSSLVVVYDFIRSQINARIALVVLVVLIAVWLAPLVKQSIVEAYERTKPYTLTDMTVWASSTLADGGIITEGAGSRAFSHEMGGYTGPHRIWEYGVDVLSKSPGVWQQAGYQYVEIVPAADQSLDKTAEGRAYLQQLLELRRFPPPESVQIWTGPSFVVYQLNRPELALSFDFGRTLRLVGVDGVQSSVTVGDSMALRFYWQAPHTPADNYSLFIHLTSELNRDKLTAQADGAPGPSGRPTLTWAVPSETLVSAPFSLTFPANIAPGLYKVWIGLYNPTSGQRLTTPTGDDSLLATITVISRSYF